MKKMTLISAGAAMGLLSTSCYANDISAKSFVQKASVANEFEIESSKLALKKSSSGDVKKFAQMIIDDHTKTGEKLKDTLKSSKTDAKPAAALDGKHQKLISKLESATGTEFDNQYIAMQTDAHKEAVGLFTDYTKNGTDPALKDFAGNTLPALESHLQHVQNLSDSH